MTRSTAAVCLYPAPPADLARAPHVDASQPYSDHALMIAVRNGDLDCMGELFERHHGPLFGYLLKLTGNRTAAEDLTQIVFQRMLKYRHTYRDEGRFTTWMYHLARSCSSDHFRKSASAPVPVDPSALEHHTDPASGADEAAMASDDHALLHRALGRLGPDEREVLLLSRLQELSFSEIASILECSAGAARVRAHRALRALRDHYLQMQKETPT